MVAMGKGQILLFSIPQEKAKQIQARGAAMDIPVRQVAPVDYGRTLHEILTAAQGEDGGRKKMQASSTASSIYQSMGFPVEMMVFCGLSDKGLDDFLADYRKTGLAPVPLKAVITPYNMTWTAEQLFTALMKEHTAMHSR